MFPSSNSMISASTAVLFLARPGLFLRRSLPGFPPPGAGSAPTPSPCLGTGDGARKPQGTLGKNMENIWKTYGKYIEQNMDNIWTNMENTWTNMKNYGKYVENMENTWKNMDNIWRNYGHIWKVPREPKKLYKNHGSTG